jgi:hypothetical protein
MKKLFFAAFACYFFSACTKSKEAVILPKTSSQQISSNLIQNVITLPKKVDSTIYIADASFIQPGSVIELEGWYKSIYIKNLQGTAAAPITFINKGQVRVGGYSNYTAIFQGKFFKILGNGDATIKNGIRISSFNTSYYASGINLGNSSNVEIANCEIDHFGVGIIQNPSTGTMPMLDCYYHNNYIHDLGNPSENGRAEAFYLGNTSSTIPYKFAYRFTNCRIENNILENLSGDGIQVANGTFVIKGNTIRNFATAQLADQRNGILIGGNATAKVIGNRIDGGRGNALMILGVGKMIVKNNVFKNIDVSNLTSQDLVYINARVNVEEGAPLFSVDFSNNSIQGKTNRYALTNMTSTLLTSGGTFTNNIISGTNLKPYALSSKDQWIITP